MRDEAKRAAFQLKYEQYALAGAERAATMPPPPSLPPCFQRDVSDDRRPPWATKGGGRAFGGRGFGGGSGRFGGGKGSSGDPPPTGRGFGGRPFAPLEFIARPIVTYRDLDAPEDDLFS